ncbi:MAG TPA: peptidylprolyl isomerase [Candidatus Sulfotelmatobacter sp.]|nr:peptidylprolyl isomerase [Candidatus Sulfotelmatobacter sp.]
MRALSRMLLAGLIVAGAFQVRAELANGIKAIVHDSVITYEDVESLTGQTADVLARQYRNQPQTFEKKMNDMREENLQKLMDRQLILHEFKTAGYTLPESVIDDVVQERIRSRFGDRVTLTKTLQAQGMTYEKFREQVREQFIVEALRSKNISSEIIISPHKVEAYYLAHRDGFKVEEEVKLRMIVLNKGSETNAPTVRKLADEILCKLKEGAAFAEMATIYSQGSQRNQGGDWGWVEKSVLRKELADVAFGLKPGELSGIIETPESYYLMRVEDARTAHFRSLGEVRDQIERNLLLEERNRLEKQWIERLKKKTFVRYF